MISKDDAQNLLSSKNFCAAAWMHLHVINDGRAFPCCMTPIDDKNSLGNVKTTSIINIMNSDAHKTMRKNMLEDKPLPESCHRCTEKEASNINTMRTGMNGAYGESNLDLIMSTQDDGTIEKANLQYWDFRFSNFCNLACRTCSPLFSTSWFSDAKKTGNMHSIGIKALIDLNDADLFWAGLEEQIDNLLDIQFAGGEPILMEEHWKLIKMLEDRNKTNVNLRYSTNTTKLSYKGMDMIEVWKRFKKVHLSLSVDGVGDHFEYIRHKGKWSDSIANMKRLRETKVVDYWIHPTISILNIFHLTTLHKTLWDADLIPTHGLHDNAHGSPDDYFVSRFHLNPLFTPEASSIKALPKELKERAEYEILQYGRMMFEQHDIPMSGWESIIDFMWSHDDSHLFPRFIEDTKKLDAIRGQDFTEIEPLFKPYFK
jgi:radical SAM protein with 4Fe4S-binding SPASM domain